MHTPTNSYMPIFQPTDNTPMNVVFFVSGTGGNLQCAIDLKNEKPGLLTISLVIADRFNIKALEIARKNNIDVFVLDFEKTCGSYAENKKNVEELQLYRARSEQFHDSIFDYILNYENSHRKFDLAVLSYRRLIHGKLLEYFHDQMINQHPADLTVMDTSERLLTGCDPVMKAIKNGFMHTRTTTHMVRAGMDNGEILAQGPWITYSFDKINRTNVDLHEKMQKQVSDWPCLRFTLESIAMGKFGISLNQRHADGCKMINYEGKLLPYGGISIL